MKYKILIIPIVIILLIFIWMAVTDKQDKPVRSEPELRFNGVVEYTEPKKSQNLRLMATNGLIFVNNLETQTVKFANDPSNPYAMKVSLYLGDGTMLFDTPGFTSFDILEADEEELQHLYPEIAPYAGKCRYDNCRHIKEPECAVRAAVESGEISQQRYDSYKTQLEEIQQKNRY